MQGINPSKKTMKGIPDTMIVFMLRKLVISRRENRHTLIISDNMNHNTNIRFRVQVNVQTIAKRMLIRTPTTKNIRHCIFALNGHWFKSNWLLGSPSRGG